MYGAKNFAALAWKEIDEGRAVAVNVTGWRKPVIYRVLSMYAQHDEMLRNGRQDRALAFGLGWRTLFAPSIIGLCQHARSRGMAVKIRSKGAALEVRFQKPESGGS
jgi:hypothetical protein